MRSQNNRRASFFGSPRSALRSRSSSRRAARKRKKRPANPYGDQTHEADGVAFQTYRHTKPPSPSCLRCVRSTLRSICDGIKERQTKAESYHSGGKDFLAIPRVNGFARHCGWTALRDRSSPKLTECHLCGQQQRVKGQMVCPNAHRKR